MTSSKDQSRTSPGVRFLNGLEATVSWASGLALICVTATIFFNASGRYLTGWSFLGGEELARLLTVWITFVGAYVFARQEKHVNIDLVLGAAAPKLQRLMRGGIAIIGMIVMVYLAITSWNLSAFSFGTGQMGTTLPVPRGLFFLPVLVGSVLMFVAYAEVFVRAVLNRLAPLEIMGPDASENSKDEA